MQVDTTRTSNVLGSEPSMGTCYTYDPASLSISGLRATSREQEPYAQR